MSQRLSALVDKIKAALQKMDQDHAAVVLQAIELGRLFVALRKKVRRGVWEKTLKDLGFDPRVVCRYLALGESWWTNQAIGPDLLAQLPCDPHKLVWLCRLSPEELPNFLKVVDCKDGSRGAVIKAVQQIRGEKPPASAEQQVTIQALKKRWADYVNRMVAAIDSLPEETVDEQTRQQLRDELYAKFAELEEALEPPGDDESLEGEEGIVLGPADEAGQDSDGPPEAAESPDDVTEEPPPAAPPRTQRVAQTSAHRRPR
jgi:hypothetical protein